MGKHKQRGGVFSDLHCGHLAGLCPPNWWGTDTRKHAEKIKRETWAAWKALVKEVGKLDFAIINGDLIDGKGERSGGTELITSDREEQADMATRALQMIQADKFFMTAGTPYHAGASEDFEKIAARALDADFQSQQWLDVNGCIINARHFVGGSSIPHGRFTAIARAKLWNSLWAERKGQPNADLIFRSHVHSHIFAGDARWTGIITPALQAACTKYGGRKCEGTVDWGCITMEIESKEKKSWQAHIYELPTVQVKATRV